MYDAYSSRCRCYDYYCRQRRGCHYRSYRRLQLHNLPLERKVHIVLECQQFQEQLGSRQGPERTAQELRYSRAQYDLWLGDTRHRTRNRSGRHSGM